MIIAHLRRNIDFVHGFLLTEGVIRTRTAFPVADDPTMADPAVLGALPDTLRAAQRVFDRTGGLHAAAS